MGLLCVYSACPFAVAFTEDPLEAFYAATLPRVCDGHIAMVLCT
jgi:hypothetical protein